MRAVGAQVVRGVRYGQREGVRLAARARSRRRLAALPDATKLHIGCGPNHLPGWVNVDLDRSVGPDVRLDLRGGIPVRPGSLAYVYTEHVLEHLTLEDGCRVLADLAVGLARGGVVRIAMPDLGALVEAYGGDWRTQAWLEDPVYAHVDTPAYMLNYALRAWGHRYVYDRDDLQLRLQQAGFVTWRACAWGESEHEALRGLETRPDSLLIVEAEAG